jgi:peroxiredoxin
MKNLIIAILLVVIVSGLKCQTEKDVIEAKGLLTGTAAPLFNAMDADSNHFSLKDALNKSPVVLIFYRGFWCPVCNEHLSNLQDSLQLIEEAGAKIIAVSPEKPEYLEKMSEKTGATYTLLYDEDYKIAGAYDVSFKPTSMQLFTYNVFLGGKLKKTHSDDSQRLPIPATYIINEEGVIIWKQFDPDYKNRASVSEILDALAKNGDSVSVLK